MKPKNDETDEICELLESCGITLTAKEKELILKTRQDERHARENLTAEQQLRNICRLRHAGRGLVQRSLAAYLAVCRKNAEKPQPKNVIDTKQIYESRRVF